MVVPVPWVVAASRRTVIAPPAETTKQIRQLRRLAAKIVARTGVLHPAIRVLALRAREGRVAGAFAATPPFVLSTGMTRPISYIEYTMCTLSEGVS